MENNRLFYAHHVPDAEQNKWQLLSNHLQNVARYAEQLGSDAGVSQFASIAGFFHDLGKYSDAFQKRIRGSRIRVDHATAGAKEIINLFKNKPQQPLALIIAYCISGHHSGLLDYGDESDLPGDGTLVARLKTEVYDYSAYKSEIDLRNLELPKQLNIRPLNRNIGFSMSFLTRMIYSALVDADFLDTEEFMQGNKPRGNYDDILTLADKFSINIISSIIRLC